MFSAIIFIVLLVCLAAVWAISADRPGTDNPPRGEPQGGGGGDGTQPN